MVHDPAAILLSKNGLLTSLIRLTLCSHFFIIDQSRMKIVEIGGAQELLNMLGSAKDDAHRKRL